MLHDVLTKKKNQKKDANFYWAFNIPSSLLRDSRKKNTWPLELWITIANNAEKRCSFAVLSEGKVCERLRTQAPSETRNEFVFVNHCDLSMMTLFKQLALAHFSLWAAQWINDGKFSRIFHEEERRCASGVTWQNKAVSKVIAPISLTANENRERSLYHDEGLRKRQGSCSVFKWGISGMMLRCSHCGVSDSWCIWWSGRCRRSRAPSNLSREFETIRKQAQPQTLSRVKVPMVRFSFFSLFECSLLMHLKQPYFYYSARISWSLKTSHATDPLQSALFSTQKKMFEFRVLLC